MNMTKLLFFIIVPFAILLQPNTALAKEPPNTLYCPEKIECLKDKSVSSCKAIGEHLEYWGKIYSDGTIKKGVYFLTRIDSSYQYPYTFSAYPNRCSYGNIDYPTSPILGISSSEFASYNYELPSWEAKQNDTTKWWIYGYQAQCNNGGLVINPQDCPLEMVPLIKIKSDYGANIARISAYANGILLNDDYWYPNFNSPFYWKAINLYQAWDSCSDVGLCTIELMATINEALVDVGSIVVDIENKMKIVHVHAITGFEISHDEKLNSIEIKTTL